MNGNSQLPSPVKFMGENKMSRNDADARNEADTRVLAGDRSPYRELVTVSGSSYYDCCLAHSSMETNLANFTDPTYCNLNLYGNPWVVQSGNWSVQGIPGYYGARPTGSFAAAMATIDVGVSDCTLYSYLDFYGEPYPGASFDRDFGFILRWADSSNYILLYFAAEANSYDGQWKLQVVESGVVTETILGEEASTYPLWLVAIYLDGSSIRLDRYVEGMTYVTAIQAQISAHQTNTAHGFYFNAAGGASCEYEGGGWRFLGLQAYQEQYSYERDSAY